jgi:hypothetical protein
MIFSEHMNVCNILCGMLSVQNAAIEYPPFLSMYKETSKSARQKPKYSLSVCKKVLYVCLDYSSLLDSLLVVKHPTSIIDGLGEGGNIGMTSGQIVSLAYMIPYALIFRTLSSTNAKAVVFCGNGLSGTVAHTAALICRHYAFAAGDKKLTIKCISFSGPLIGNKALHAYLKSNNASDLHVTVNHAVSVLDRLIVDLSLLSLMLTTVSQDRAWAQAYGVIYLSLKRYLTSSPSSASDDLAASDLLEKLCDAELSLQPQIMAADIIEWSPIGQYLFVSPHLPQAKSEGLPSSFTEADILMCSDEKAARDKFNMIWALTHTTHNLCNSPPQTSHTSIPSIPSLYTEKAKAITLDVMPKLIACSIQYATHLFSYRSDGDDTGTTIDTSHSQVQFIFDGKNIDTVHYRDWGHEVKINGLDSSCTDMPFTITQGDYQLSTDAKIVLVKVELSEDGVDMVSVIVRGISFRGNGSNALTVRLHTDFGSSNDMKCPQPNAPLPLQLSALMALHPTMNTTLLLGALVRVALCFRASVSDYAAAGGSMLSEMAIFQQEHHEMYELWELLIAVEKELFEPQDHLLEAFMKLYIHERNDIAIFVNSCLNHVERMSALATSLHFDENAIIHGARTVLGEWCQVS